LRYIGEQFSAACAARALYTHRTVLNRLRRAERLITFRLAGHALMLAARDATSYRLYRS
jgi:hypothetical protein